MLLQLTRPWGKPLRSTAEVGHGDGSCGVYTGYATIGEMIADYASPCCGSPDLTRVYFACPTVSSGTVGDLCVIEAVAGRNPMTFTRTFPVGDTALSACAPCLRTNDSYHTAGSIACVASGHLYVVGGLHNDGADKLRICKSDEPLTGAGGWTDVTEDFLAVHTPVSMTYPIFGVNPFDHEELWFTWRDRPEEGSAPGMLWIARYTEAGGWGTPTCLFGSESPATTYGKGRLRFGADGKVWTGSGVAYWTWGCDYVFDPALCYTADDGATWRAPNGDALTPPITPTIVTANPSMCALPAVDEDGYLRATSGTPDITGAVNTYWVPAAFPWMVASDNLPTVLARRSSRTASAFVAEAHGWQWGSNALVNGWGADPIHWDGDEWVTLPNTANFGENAIAMNDGGYVCLTGTYVKALESGYDGSSFNTWTRVWGNPASGGNYPAYDANAARQLGRMRGFNWCSGTTPPNAVYYRDEIGHPDYE